MSALTGQTRDAKSGEAQALVVFVHGYGADGADLLGIGDVLADHVPDVMFAAPNAPDRCTNNPAGFQWFPIPWLDGSSEEDAKAGMMRAVEMFDTYLSDLMAETGIGPEKTVLFGFSQGTMMSLHVGPRRDDPLAGIIGFSGRLLAPENLSDVVTKPPVLLVHGDSDDVVPPSSLPEAADALGSAGFEVYTHISQGTGHGIAPDGLGVALSFLRHVLGMEPPESDAAEQ